MNDATFSRISIVIPVYKSGLWLGELADAISFAVAPWCGNHEIIFVDDCSPDDTWNRIQDLCRANPHIKGVHLMHNEGQAKATLCGLAHASGEVVVTMDDDFQHLPSELPKLLKALAEESELDCVVGYFMEKQHSSYRNLGSCLIQKINALAFQLPKGVRSSAFRCIRRAVVDAILAQRMMNPAITVLLFSCTRRVISIPVGHAPRRFGHSNYTLFKQLRLALDIITNATMLPLRAVSAFGLATCGLSMILMLYYLIRFFLGKINEPGFITLVLLLTFFSGAILLALGVIGEYIVRVLREVRQRPMYFIRETAGTFDRLPATTAGAPPS